jgi:hypothetical protein
MPTDQSERLRAKSDFLPGRRGAIRRWTTDCSGLLWRGDASPCLKPGTHGVFVCPRSESPGMYMPAMTGELVLAGQR